MSLLEQYRDDPLLAEREALRIRHRDKRYKIPFVRNPLQQYQWDVIQKIRAINIANHMRVSSWALDFVERTAHIRTRWRPGERDPLTFREVVEALVRFGVPRLVAANRRANQEEPGEVLQDGPVQVVALKHRRGGCSTGFAAIGFLEAMLWDSFKVELHAQKGDAVRQLLTTCRGFYTNWPADKDEALRRLSVQNQSAWEWPHDSTFKVFTAGSDDASRGFEADFYLLTEYAHYPDVELANASLAAKQAHAWVFKESTANGASGHFFDEYEGARSVDDVVEMYERQDFESLANWNHYYRFFFGWVDDPGYRMTCSPEEARHIMGSLDALEQRVQRDRPDLTAEQVKWMRFKRNDLRPQQGMTAEQFFLQEFPHTEDAAFQATGRKVFDTEKLAEGRTRAKEKRPACFRLLDDHFKVEGAPPIVRCMPFEATLQIVEPPVKGACYVIGGDVSQGLPHGDFSVLSVHRRLSTMRTRQVAMYRGKINAKRLGDVAWMLALAYNQAFVMIEVNGPGQSANERLALDNLYPHIYQRESPDRVDVNMRSPGSFRFGYLMNVLTKARAIETMMQAVTDHAIEWSFPQAVKEAIDYERTDRGGYSAPAGMGFYDDCVIADALAYLAHVTPSMALPFAEESARRRAELLATGETRHEDALVRDFLRSLRRSRAVDEVERRARARARLRA